MLALMCVSLIWFVLVQMCLCLLGMWIIMWPVHLLSCPHPLAIRHQVILDAALGAPIFSQLILGYLLQVEHRHLSWPAPHSATGGSFKVIPLALVLCCFFFASPPLLLLFPVIVPGFSFFLLELDGWCFLLPVLLLRLALLLLASWWKFLRDNLGEQ